VIFFDGDNIGTVTARSEIHVIIINIYLSTVEPRHINLVRVVYLNKFLLHVIQVVDKLN
jgi:hypothetical protein